MIEMMLTEMRSFLLLFLVMLVAFTTSMYTAYGYKDPKTFTLFRSLLMRMQETFDSVDTTEAMSHNRVLGVFFSVLFMLGLSLLLLNLLVAILTSAYESATQVRTHPLLPKFICCALRHAHAYMSSFP
jgi:uncharacterized membrane protein